MLDSILGPTNFRSEIIWRRSPSHNKLSKQYGPIHDTVLFYAKSEDAKGEGIQALPGAVEARFFADRPVPFFGDKLNPPRGAHDLKRLRP